MARNSSGAAGLVVVVGFFALLVAMCSAGGQRDSQRSSVAQAPAAPQVPTESSRPEMTETQFVSTSTLNLRSSPNGKIIGRLAGGDSVVVYERKGEWARVSAQGVPAKWVSSKLLCSGSGCYRPTNRPVSPSRKNLRPARSDYSDGSCPCSGSRVCIGPRGGRYCITSGGNKRYGV
ncbi:SH3 domain-containing protein [Stenotrophomonas indicatrix]|uniref:SH3 domain-containing protein n=1 Tax=Stenotrophomonas indicatrix TaxID=2045451 RepID=UPI003CCEEF09